MNDNKTLLQMARKTLEIHEELSDDQAIALIHLWLSDRLPPQPLPEFPSPLGFETYWRIRFAYGIDKDIPFTLPTIV